MFCLEREMEKGAESKPKDSHSVLDGDEFIFKEFICGEEALKISPVEPYCLSHPIRRGHLNISHHYPLQQVALVLLHLTIVLVTVTIMHTMLYIYTEI